MSVRNLAVSLLSAGAMLPAPAARGQTLTTLYEFIGGRTGGNPASGVILLGRVLYGTTPVGGSANDGTVFKVNATTGAHKVIYSFVGGADGQSPDSGLIYRSGDLYGTTSAGGSAGAGTVFSVDSATKTETVVHSLAERMGVARVN